MDICLLSSFDRRSIYFAFFIKTKNLLRFPQRGFMSMNPQQDATAGGRAEPRTTAAGSGMSREKMKWIRAKEVKPDSFFIWFRELWILMLSSMFFSRDFSITQFVGQNQATIYQTSLSAQEHSAQPTSKQDHGLCPRYQTSLGLILMFWSVMAASSLAMTLLAVNTLY